MFLFYFFKDGIRNAPGIEYELGYFQLESHKFFENNFINLFILMYQKNPEQDKLPANS